MTAICWTFGSSISDLYRHQNLFCSHQLLFVFLPWNLIFQRDVILGFKCKSTAEATLIWRRAVNCKYFSRWVFRFCNSICSIPNCLRTFTHFNVHEKFPRELFHRWISVELLRIFRCSFLEHGRDWSAFTRSLKWPLLNCHFSSPLSWHYKPPKLLKCTLISRCKVGKCFAMYTTFWRQKHQLSSVRVSHF